MIQGLHKTLTSIEGREINSTIVWSNKYQDDEDVVSYCVKTKSKGERLMSKWNWYTIPKTDTLGKKW